MIKFGYAIILCVHWFGCLWIWIGTRKFVTNDPTKPWLIKQPELKGQKLYIFVTYWVYTVITTVGYGDFIGGTTLEFLVTILIEFFGIIVFTVLNNLAISLT